MSILFAITLISFFSLFGVTLLIVRHVRITGARITLHFGAAVATRSLPEPDARRATFTDPGTASHLPPKEADWRFLITPGPKSRRGSRLHSLIRATRKPTMSLAESRPDDAHFNHQLGDISDPYEPRSGRASTGSARP